MNEQIQAEELSRILKYLRSARKAVSLSQIAYATGISDLVHLRLLMAALEDHQIVLLHRGRRTTKYSLRLSLEQTNQTARDEGEPSVRNDERTSKEVEYLLTSPSTSLTGDRTGAENHDKGIDDSEKALAKRCRRYPRMSQTRKLELAERILSGSFDECRRSQDILVKQFSFLVRKIARSMCWNLKDLADLIQEGSLACLESFQKFDIEKSTNLDAFVAHCIHSRILRYVAKHGLCIRLPEYIQEAQVKIRRSRTVLNSKLGREPTDKEIAADAKLTEKKVKLIAQLETRGTPVSLDQPLSGADDDMPLESHIACGDSYMAEIAAERAEYIAIINEMWSALTDEEVRVLKLRYGFETEVGLTCEEIGALSDVRRQAISQTQLRGLQKLRDFVEVEEDSSGELSVSKKKVDRRTSPKRPWSNKPPPSLSSPQVSYGLNAVRDQLYQAILNLLLENGCCCKKDLINQRIIKVIESLAQTVETLENSEAGRKQAPAGELLFSVIQHLLADGFIREAFGDEFVLTYKGLIWLQSNKPKIQQDPERRRVAG
jgi:RNA polymerase sigma factor (sigma-70 family)